MNAYTNFNDWKTTREEPETVAELIAFIKDAMRGDEADTITRLKTIYFPLGKAWAKLQKIDHRAIKGAGGVREYCVKTIGKTYTHINNCYRASKVEAEFWDAMKWYQDVGRNSLWQPRKTTGPEFVLELVKEYGQRDEPAKPRVEKKGLAEKAKDAAMKWRRRCEAMIGETRKLSVMFEYESRVLVQIEAEIGQENGSTDAGHEADDIDSDMKASFHDCTESEPDVLEEQADVPKSAEPAPVVAENSGEPEHDPEPPKRRGRKKVCQGSRPGDCHTGRG